MSFRDSVVRGVQLIRTAIQSPNYVSGSAGWTINKDGSAEFLSAVFRGLIDAIGSSGAKIRLDPTGTYPALRFFSPDGTNQAFIRLISGTANSADLDIVSGFFVYSIDSITRYFEIFLSKSNTAFYFLDTNQQRRGGMVRILVESLYVGVEDIVASLGVYIEIKNADPGTVSFRRTDATDLRPLPIKNVGRIIPQGIIVNRKTSVAVPATTAGATPSVEIQDGQITNNAFIAYDGRTYEIMFTCRCSGSAAATTGDVRIRDGGASNPTIASTAIAASSIHLPVGGGAGATFLVVKQTLNCPGDIAVGTHTLGVFYQKTAGAVANTFVVETSSAGSRELTVADVGSA